MSYAAPGEEISHPTPTYQNSLLSRPVDTKYGPTPRQQNTQADDCEKRPALSKIWQFLMDICLVEDRALEKEIMRTLPEYK